MSSDERIDLGVWETKENSESEIGVLYVEQVMASGQYRIYAEPIPEPTLAEQAAEWWKKEAPIGVFTSEMMQRIFDHFDLIPRPTVPDEVWARRPLLNLLEGEVQALREWVAELVPTLLPSDDHVGINLDSHSQGFSIHYHIVTEREGSRVAPHGSVGAR